MIEELLLPQQVPQQEFHQEKAVGGHHQQQLPQADSGTATQGLEYVQERVLGAKHAQGFETHADG